MIPRSPGLHLLVLAAWLGPGAGLAAQSGETRYREWNLEIPRLGANEKIKVDGRFDEAAWSKAARLGKLTQVEPDEGASATMPTMVRICYDRDYLHLAIQCIDSPDAVRGRLMQRDANLDPDDRVEFWLDTFNDKRFAYWFQIGAGGSKGDALIGGGFNKSWDGIWFGRSRTTDRGWQAEVSIPFKTLSFKENGGTWGFNLRRQRKASDEEDRWAAPLVAYQFFSIAQGGTISGLSGLRHGIGLDVVPYAKFGASRDRTVDKHTSRTGDFGLDVNYRLSPALNLRLTYNTDFAETEVDTRQTNLTRFPLFFPEKRDFFLEDSGLFEFGVTGRRPALIPFFSRRIGRDGSGEAIPIIVGGKLTGRVDDWNLGLLNIYQDNHVDADGNFSDRRDLGVLRVSKNVGRESSVGMIATRGRPTDRGEAYTAGADFHYGDSRAFGEGHAIDIYGWWLGSHLDGPGGDDNAFGLQAEYKSKEWDLLFLENHVEADFSPELGFVRRTGIREHRARARYVWRSGESWIRRWSTRVSPRIVTTEQGSKDSWDLIVRPGEVTFSSGDMISYDIRREFWRLREGFDITDAITIPTGDYHFTNHVFELDTSEKRAFYLRAEARAGGFYSGSITSFEVDPTLILGRYVHIGAGYEQNHVVLDEGKFTTRVYSGRVDLSFSPDVSLKNFVQYDSDSKNLSAQSRLRWIHRPGQELFLVGLYAWEKADTRSPFVPTSQETALKIVYTIRF